MKMILRCLAAAGWLLAATSAAGESATDQWRLTFDTRWLGPMEAHVEITQADGKLRGVSLSGSAAILRELPGDHDVGDSLMVFEAMAGEDGSFAGSFLAPWREGELKLTIDGDSLSGSVEGGAFAGSLSGRRVARADRIRDYVAVLERFDRVVANKVFAPGDLDSPGYRKFRGTMGRIVAAAADDMDMLLGFHLAWQNEPFSHFSLKRSLLSAEQMFAMFDAYRVGFEAATVEFEGDVAVLTVRTMMGADTIEQIEAAYEQIAAAAPRALVIDLRGNNGGAFAVKPLVEHVIDTPLDAGYFLSQAWNRDYARLPTRNEIMAADAWQGWSIVSFWKAVQELAILRVQFRPAEPNFDGPVYVLLDGSTASAAEMAADALRTSGVATLVGERSAGEMLSQSMFDVAEGFVVSLPVADYYSLEYGRIEGQGVPVDVPVDAAKALDEARRLAATPRQEPAVP